MQSEFKGCHHINWLSLVLAGIIGEFLMQTQVIIRAAEINVVSMGIARSIFFPLQPLLC